MSTRHRHSSQPASSRVPDSTRQPAGNQQHSRHSSFHDNQSADNRKKSREYGMQRHKSCDLLPRKRHGDPLSGHEPRAKRTANACDVFDQPSHDVLNQSEKTIRTYQPSMAGRPPAANWRRTSSVQELKSNGVKGKVCAGVRALMHGMLIFYKRTGLCSLLH